MPTSVAAARPAERPVTLHDRYALEEGRVFLSGVQALVRVLLDQHRADRRAGLRTATLVSGYQGSPLGGFDREVARLGALGAEHDVVLRPGVNEELGATAVWGSQLTGTLPGARYDGVVGVWYGKAPGVDRAADAIRHGNAVGAAPRGGVLALAGDDPACKSSTLPSASEALLAALHVPVFAPADVQDVLDLGRHAIACSRASGLWSALKVVTAVADATATADVGLARVEPVMPEAGWGGAPYVHRPSAHLLAPESLEMERTLVGVRTDLARAYARLNGLNRVVRDDPGARLGIVVAGTPARDLEQALADLGAHEGAVPLRVLKVAMLHPLDGAAVRAFAKGLDEVLVIEEKGPFLERAVKEELYGTSAAPAVTGARDDRGAPLVPATGALDADGVARAAGARILARHPGAGGALERLEALDRIERRARASTETAQRTPFFCSGCPHNVSTAAPDGALVGAGIGCHTMVLLNPAGRGRLTGVTQMGGEGAQWIGAAPFVEPGHFVQNLGDGTFHHSGSLAIRAAIAAGVDVTYKLLYNDTVAMTGGQAVQGRLDVPALTRLLAAEGVARIAITTEDVSRHRGAELAPIASVHDRRELAGVQRELAAVPGVSVLIHDQGCAAETRRARRRGLAPDPPQRVVINERVCEGCGDCGEKSGCLSVEPVQTEFGRKTRIHQASCNKDLTCLEGDCPAFLTVIAPDGGPVAVTLPRAALPEPVALHPEAADVRIRLVGIGGTGVVTVSQVLGMAALIDGRAASGMDQTGLSQKGGPVVSDVRLGAAGTGSAVPSAGGADVLLALDLLGAAAPARLRAAAPQRTVAVVSTSVVPTGRMVTDAGAGAPDAGAALGAIEAVAREVVTLDAQALSHALFADHMPANLIVLGAAWQHGAIPLSREAVESALRLNGAGVERNLAAFTWGRACVAAPEEVAALLAGAPGAAPAEDGLDALVSRRIADLTAYQSARYAARYADALARIAAAERSHLPGSDALSCAVARNLHKLMAYKDEYEVARLHLDGLAALEPGTRAWVHLHPPALRALGLRRKLRLGRWSRPGLRALRAGRRLRGTPLDPFGRARVRRVERALVGEYLEHVDAALDALSPATRDVALALCELPDVIRGYEGLKLRNVERFRARAAELRERLAQAAG